MACRVAEVELGGAASARVRARFSIAAHVAQVGALYEEIWAEYGA